MAYLLSLSPCDPVDGDDLVFLCTKGADRCGESAVSVLICLKERPGYLVGWLTAVLCIASSSAAIRRR